MLVRQFFASLNVLHSAMIKAVVILWTILWTQYHANQRLDVSRDATSIQNEGWASICDIQQTQDIMASTGHVSVIGFV